ncbi:MAG: bifunctional helix-turn-helix domain-containing protein/methylated-DNA--[protein]-cysteine S-methyltransferase [Bacteroidia bacterium]
MNEQNILNYQRIAAAIEFIKTNFKAQPSLEQIAAAVHLSPFHFQRLFAEWAGTSPKKFLQYISIEHAKYLLGTKQQTLFNIALETGFSSTSVLHNLFVKIESMTPAEYKNGGKNLVIDYCFESSPFGSLIIASTPKGICYIAFVENEEVSVNLLRTQFPAASFVFNKVNFHNQVKHFFESNIGNQGHIKLHLKGTDFQLKVWEALLKIPFGELSTYGQLAKKINNPNASRAVGTAIGSNPIAFIIPCHRVIQASGLVGGYMWGSTRKTAIIGWESAINENEKK